MSARSHTLISKEDSGIAELSIAELDDTKPTDRCLEEMSLSYQRETRRKINELIKKHNVLVKALLVQSDRDAEGNYGLNDY